MTECPTCGSHVLPPEAYAKFLEVCDNPPPANEALKALVRSAGPFSAISAYQAALPKPGESGLAWECREAAEIERKCVDYSHTTVATLERAADAIETLTRENAELKFLNAEHETFAAECQRQHAAQLSTLRREVIGECAKVLKDMADGADSVGNSAMAAELWQAVASIRALPDATGTKEGGR